jgi:hypothetical protein
MLSEISSKDADHARTAVQSQYHILSPRVSITDDPDAGSMSPLSRLSATILVLHRHQHHQEPLLQARHRRIQPRADQVVMLMDQRRGRVDLQV